MSRDGQSHLIKRAILFFICFTIGKVSFALDPEIPLAQYQIDSMFTEDFSDNTVLSLIQTSDGYLWVGTQAGLYRYDGERSARYSRTTQRGMQSDRIATLSLDRSNILWLGTMGGLTSYEHGQFQTFTTTDGLSGDDIISLIHDSSGRQWISTFNNMLTCRREGETTIYDQNNGLEGDRILSMLEDISGVLWFGTDRRGLFQFHRGNFVKPDLPSLKNNFTVYDMAVDRKGVIWFATDEGLFRLSDRKVTHLTVNEGLTTNLIKDVLIDSDDNIWCGTENGLVRLIVQPSGGFLFDTIWRTVNITCLFEDRDKGLWIGTKQLGLVRMRESLFRSVTGSGPSPMNVISLFEDKNSTIWIGTSYGLYFSRNGVLSEFSIESSLLAHAKEPTWIRAMCEDSSNNLWVSTQGSGLLRINNETIEDFTIHDGLPSNFIKSLFFDSAQRLWIGTDRGLTVYQSGIFTLIEPSHDWFRESIYFVYEDHLHNFWIGTPFGVVLVEKGEFTEETMQFFNLDVPCLSIYEDDRHVFWVCTFGKGLCMISEEVIFHFTSRTGLKSNHLSSLLEDDQGYFWLTSRNGVLRIKIQYLDDSYKRQLDSVECQVFDKNNGLPSAKCSLLTRQAILKTRSNEYWFATDYGIAIIGPSKRRQKNLSLPTTLIDRITCNGHDILPPFPENSVFRCENLSFHFLAPRFLYRDQFRFRYRLNNYDSNWMKLQSSDETVATYTNLPSGSYTFEVQVSDSAYIGTVDNEHLLFTIQPSTGLRSRMISAITLILSFILVISIMNRRKRRRQVATHHNENQGMDGDDTRHDDMKTDEYLQKLLYALQKDKIFRNENLSLQSLAEHMEIPAHQVSKVINEKCGKNFFDLINFYRVDDAKQILLDPDNNEKLILTIAFDVGFNSKAAFYRAFKKFTRMTPSEYKKRYQKPDFNN